MRVVLACVLGGELALASSTTDAASGPATRSARVQLRAETITSFWDGHETRTVVGVDTGRTVSLDRWRAAMSVPAASTDPCKDRAYKVEIGPYSGTYQWWFRQSTTPSYLDRDKVAVTL